MSNQGKNNSFLKQAGILTAAGILCRIIGILYRSPLTGIIGVEGNGYYTTAYNYYVIILLVSSYSIPSAISKEISIKLAMKEYKNAQRIFYCALVYVMAIGGLASVITFFYAGIFVENNSVLVLKVFAPTIFFSGLLGVLRGYFQAHRTMLQTSVSQILEQILNAVISILAAYLLINTVSNQSSTLRAIYGAAGSAIGTGIGVITALLFMIFVYIFNRNIIKRRIQHDLLSTEETYKQVFRKITLTVTPIILSTFIYNFNSTLNNTLYTKILIYLKGFGEKTTATWYGIFAGEALLITNVPIAVASAMSSAIMPTISGTYMKGNLQETNERIGMAIHTTLLLSIPSAVGLAVLSRPVVQLLFPQPASLVQAAALLRMLSITVVFYSLSTLTNAILQAIGKVNLPVKNASFSLLLQTLALLAILFGTDWNLYALVIAAILYSFLMCLFNGISVYKNLGYRMKMRKNVLIPFAAAAIMGLAAALSYQGLYMVFSSNVLSLFVTIGISVLVYFCSIIKLGGLSEEELRGVPKGNTLVRLAKKIKLL
jgi:stage V sporulation protein B